MWTIEQLDPILESEVVSYEKNQIENISAILG